MPNVITTQTKVFQIYIAAKEKAKDHSLGFLVHMMNQVVPKWSTSDDFPFRKDVQKNLYQKT
jgi:hypothetical protein